MGAHLGQHFLHLLCPASITMEEHCVGSYLGYGVVLQQISLTKLDSMLKAF